LKSTELTPFACAHGLLGVNHHGWPVEALSKHVPDQDSRGSMMSADPAMDILQ
jgi:hypothetical protein